MGLRPEQIKKAVSSKSEDITVDCKVELIEPTGPDTLITIKLNNTKAICRIQPDTVCNVGDIMSLAFDLSKVVFFDASTEERIL